MAQEQQKDQPGLEGLVVPDYVEVTVGWRAWSVRPQADLDQTPILHSVTRSYHSWPPRKRMEAVCDICSSPPFMGEGHLCGLHSARTLEDLQGMPYHRYDADANGLYHVIGTVSNWGDVIEGSQGWKSQYGYPRELYLPFEAWALAIPLSEAYGVPVRLKNILSSTTKGK